MRTSTASSSSWAPASSASLKGLTSIHLMKIGIDLGTANVIVYVKGKGIVITEPSVVAVGDDNRIVAVGEEAREMIGRTPGNIQAIRPMKDGVIADYVITEAMLRFFIGKATKGRIGFGRPEVMISRSRRA